MSKQDENKIKPRSCKWLCVQGVIYWCTWRIEKTASHLVPQGTLSAASGIHLVGDDCFFNSPGESRGCAMYVQTLAGSRLKNKLKHIPITMEVSAVASPLPW